jgi:ABC-type branched-subunit amino acid transport system substrate-binding protein
MNPAPRCVLLVWLIGLLLPLQSAVAVLDPGPAARLAADPAAEGELRALVAAGLAEGGAHASSWELLDLWLRLERDRSADPLPDWQRFRGRWPNSRYLPWADWWCARALIRAGRGAEGLALLAGLAAGGPEHELRTRATRLADRLLAGTLSHAEAEALLDSLEEPGRSWLDTRLGERRIHRRLGLVLPLKGPDAEHGRQLLSGAEAALRGRPGWRLEVADCESDPVLAWILLRELAARGDLDALLLPGDPAYVAAASFGSPIPVLLPWYEGQPLAGADGALFQFNADEETLAAGWADLLAGELAARQLITVAPATRHGRRLMEALERQLLQRGAEIETGMPQWYFPGALDLRRQLENLAIYEGAFDSSSVSLVVGVEEDMATLVRQLAWANPRHQVLGSAAFLAESARVPELSALGGQLLILSDWQPGAAIEPWQSWQREQEIVAGRAPTTREARGYESARLAVVCGELAAASGRSFRSVLETLNQPSLYGGRIRLQDRHNAQLLRLDWDGRSFRPSDTAKED